jgi:glycosyltransferase involved in cell wall biosynthesis
VLGLDNFSRKNRAQLEGLNERGYVFDVFTNDRLGDSMANVPAGNTLTIMSARAGERVRQLVRYFGEHRNEIHHAEVYPGGRFAAVYVALARWYAVPAMVVERGDLLYRERYGALTALSIRLSYRLADVVWYREFYQDGQAIQEQRLRALGARRLFFLPNAVARPVESGSDGERKVDFLWVNSLKGERKPGWVVDVLAEPEFATTRNVMLGLLGDRTADPATRANESYVRHRAPANLRLGGFEHPGQLFRTARFFLLPSDMVFCNNALLEAMSHGVVPLVSDVAGSRLIVDHGVDGFVFPHSPAGLRDAMRDALRLSSAEREQMSLAAVAKVRADFSVERWTERLASEYARLGAGALGPVEAGSPSPPQRAVRRPAP